MRHAYSAAALTAALALLSVGLQAGPASAQDNSVNSRFPVGGAFRDQPAAQQPYGHPLESSAIGLGTATVLGSTPHMGATPQTTNMPTVIGGGNGGPAPAGPAPTDAPPPSMKGAFGANWPGTIPFAVQKNPPSSESGFLCFLTLSC